MKNRLFALILLISLPVLSTSCGTLNPRAASTGPDLAATNLVLQVAVNELSAQSTNEAMTKKSLETIAAAPVNTQTPYVVTATSAPSQLPTVTPLPDITATPEIPPTLSPAEITRQADARIKSASVLVYDDPDADLRLVPRLNKAVNEFGFNAGKVVYAGNSLGTFDSFLRSQTWDLVILAVESRETVDLGKTGLLDPIYNHINHGGALIVETWNLDEDQSALGGLALNLCGAHIEKDWHRSDDYSYADFIVYPFRPESPVFSTPEKITMPLRPTVFWKGDAGDLIRIDPGGSSTILAGIPSSDHNTYGLLTSCLGGRMLLQTFSTHDYPLYETVNLWQNMMQYTLSNYFSQKPPELPGTN